MVHMVQHKDPITLTNIKQRDGESLLSYLTWFNVAAAAVKRPDDRLVHMAVVAGVNKRTKFSRDLTKKKSRDLNDFFVRAE